MYRHSVWIDVFGVVVLLILFLVPLGILAVDMRGSSWAGGHVVASRGGSAKARSPARSVRSARRAHRSARASSPSAAPIEQRPGPFGSAVPFSKSWREQATPDLSGGQGSANAVGGAGTISRGAFSRGSIEDGPRLASRGTTFGSGRGTSGEASGGAAWRHEANRLAGRARALSNRLGALERDPEGRSSGSGPNSSGRQTAESASASTNDNPPLPDPVPIDDHLHWLLVAGLLWGVWRLMRG